MLAYRALRRLDRGPQLVEREVALRPQLVQRRVDRIERRRRVQLPQRTRDVTSLRQPRPLPPPSHPMGL